MKRFSGDSGLARKIIVAKVNKKINVKIERNECIMPIPPQAYSKSISRNVLRYQAKDPLSVIKQMVVYKVQKLTSNNNNIF